MFSLVALAANRYIGAVPSRTLGCRCYRATALSVCLQGRAANDSLCVVGLSYDVYGQVALTEALDMVYEMADGREIVITY